MKILSRGGGREREGGVLEDVHKQINVLFKLKLWKWTNNLDKRIFLISSYYTDWIQLKKERYAVLRYMNTNEKSQPFWRFLRPNIHITSFYCILKWNLTLAFSISNTSNTFTLLLIYQLYCREKSMLFWMANAPFRLWNVKCWLESQVSRCILSIYLFARYFITKF